MPNNNSLNSARSLGVLGAAITPITDSVGTTDRNDYYRFVLEQNSDIFFALTGLADPAQVRIVTDLNGDGLVTDNEVVESDSIGDFSSSTADRSITGSLSAGTYWAQVFTSRDSENTSYTLDARAVQRVTDNGVDPGESLATAIDLGSLTVQQSFSDVVDTGDRQDFYKFALLKNSDVTLSLTDLGDEPAQVRIIADLNRDGLVSSSEIVAVDSVGDFSSSTDDRSITTSLAAGAYWAEVYTSRDRENTKYTLQAQATPLPNTPSFTGSIAWDTNSSVVSAFRINSQDQSASIIPIGRTIEDTNWKLQTTGDFNGDGQDDVLLRNFISGQNLLWVMKPLGEGIASEQLIGRDVPDQNWSLSGTGDFDRDGQADIILRNENADQIVAWYMNSDGTIKSESIVGRGFGDNNWKIEAVADFNRDGKSDIVLRNALSGQNLLWTMDGSSIASEALIGRDIAGADWQIEGARDFSGDGIADIFWRNIVTGQGLLWTMETSTQIGQELLISNVPNGSSQVVF